MRKIKTNGIIEQVINQLDGKINTTGFVQLKSCAAYYGVEPLPLRVYVAEDLDNKYVVEAPVVVIPIRSYDTIVGYADVEAGIVYEYGKYTATTSKQFTQICNKRFPNYERVLVDVSTADRFTKKDWGWRNR